MNLGQKCTKTFPRKGWSSSNNSLSDADTAGDEIPTSHAHQRQKLGKTRYQYISKYMENGKDQCGPEHRKRFHSHETWDKIECEIPSTAGKETKQAQAC